MQRPFMSSVALVASVWLIPPAQAAEPAAAPAKTPPPAQAKSPAAQPGKSVAELKSALETASEKLEDLREAKSSRDWNDIEHAIDTASKGVDEALVRVRGEAKQHEWAAKQIDATLKAFQDKWNEYKKMRDTKVIPTIRMGKQDEAKKLMDGPLEDLYADMLDRVKNLGTFYKR
jgi:hypothetical protein